jgi:hypothetical protein
MDNIILVHEAIHSNRENRHKGMIIKVDTSNTFDRFRHSIGSSCFLPFYGCIYRVADSCLLKLCLRLLKTNFFVMIVVIFGTTFFLI